MGSYNGKLIEPLVLSIANSAKNIWLIITPHYNSLNNSPIITPPPQKKLPNTKQTSNKKRITTMCGIVSIFNIQEQTP